MARKRRGVERTKEKASWLGPDLIHLLQERGYHVGTSVVSAFLLSEARLCSRRASRAVRAKDLGREAGASASAILDSAAACEARLSEYLAHVEYSNGPAAPDLAAVRSNRNAQLQWKQLFNELAPHIELRDNYRQLGCLMRLRDVVAHRNSRLRLIGDFPPTLAECVRAGVIPVRHPSFGYWALDVLSAVTAKWAASVATEWIAFAEETFPIGC